MNELTHNTPANPIFSHKVLIGEAASAATDVTDPASKASEECPGLFKCHHIPSSQRVPT